jgi:hypothetical protein
MPITRQQLKGYSIPAEGGKSNGWWKNGKDPTINKLPDSVV